MQTEKSFVSTPEIRARIHRAHYLKFWASVGDIVHFRSGPNRGKKHSKIPWKVVEICNDPEECIWVKNGRVPNYIKLEGEIRGTKTTVWTCQTQLTNVGVKR